MNTFFAELFAYSNHYNQQLAVIIQAEQEKCSEKSISLFNHILNAHHIWNSRITDKQTSFVVWGKHPVAELKSIDQENYQTTLEILDRYDLNDTLNYANSSGQTFGNSIRDILFHIINHSTYHRAQIASEFKQSGLQPLVTDYIFYKRAHIKPDHNKL